jgi:WD40 repeat protein
MASKQLLTTGKTSQREQRNGQFAICNLNNSNFNLTIEKLVDLDLFYCQSAVNFQFSIFMGCSDGSIRLYDLKNHEFSLYEKNIHSDNIVNLILNKNETVLISLSYQCLKLWNVINDENSGAKIRLGIINEIKFSSHQLAVPFNSYDQLISNNSFVDLANLVDLKLGNATSLVKFDSTESFLYILDKNGVQLRDIHVSNESDSSLILGSKFRKLFSLDQQATTLEAWNASHMCILLVGGQNGTIRVYKLLHQH